jgi:glutathione S-transferase
MLRWARTQNLDRPAPLSAFFERVEARPAVQQALQAEGLV